MTPPQHPTDADLAGAETTAEGPHEPGAAEPLSFPAVARLELDQLLEQLVDRAQDVLRTQGRLQGLVRALRSIASDLDLPSLLQRIVDEARDLIGAEYAALGVVGADRTLVQFVHSGMDAATVQRVGPLPAGRGLLGELITDPQPLRLSHLSGHASSSGFPPHHPPMDSFLGVPVRIGGHVFGNLYLTEKLHGEEFTAEDEELAQSLAAAAAAAIHNAQMFEDISQREQWLHASRSITNLLLHSVDRDDALLQVARSVRVVAGADFAAVVVPDESSELVVAAADGLGAADVVATAVPWHTSATGRAITLRTPVVLEDLHNQAELDGPLKELGLGPLAAVPLSSGDGVLGALAVGNRRGGRLFTTKDVELVGDFASQAALVLTVAATRAATKEAEMAEERARIARDLHDHAIQGIFSVGLTLNGLASRTSGTEAARLMELVDRLDDAIKAIRNSIFTLQLQETASPSLRAQLATVVIQSSTPLGFTPRFHTEGPVDTIVPPHVGEDLVAVLREALSNAARHARATRVEVVVSAGRAATLEVRDNGRGIGTPERSSGLANMHARAEAHGGTCHIGDSPQGGTVVRWSVPLIGP